MYREEKAVTKSIGTSVSFSDPTPSGTEGLPKCEGFVNSRSKTRVLHPYLINKSKKYTPLTPLIVVCLGRDLGRKKTKIRDVSRPLKSD